MLGSFFQQLDSNPGRLDTKCELYRLLCRPLASTFCKQQGAFFGCTLICCSTLTELAAINQP